jgi:hypothetical protein
MPVRLVLGLAAAAALAILGAARAAELSGTVGPDRLLGTRGADRIRGLAGNDWIDGRAGWDRLHGGLGRDVVLGQEGSDRIAVHADRARDSVSCGPGFDTVNAELADLVATDCELVSRQLSRDALRVDGAQHETQVEPDSLAVGSTIVTAFQSGRLVEGGAAGIGWATSSDAGRTWKTGFLERTTDRASDPVVAYDVVRRTWLIATLGADGGSTALLVSRSRDGVSWSRQQVAADDPAERYDKEWLACDPWPRSRYRGHCYLSYLDGETAQIRTRRSTDGGLTWSAPVGVAAPGSSQPNGAFPVVRPDGMLLVVFRVIAVSDNDRDAIVVTRSTDGGVTLGPVEVIAERFEEQILGVRAPVLVTADVDAGGTVYVAWGDCRFSAECFANDIVLATSRDGRRWSAPERVPFPAHPELDWFVPGLAVAPGTAGASARLAVAAYAVTKAYGCRSCETVDAFAITSQDGGRTWSPARRLNAEPMEAVWAADTSLGRMLADYVSTSFVGGRAVAVVSLAAAPEQGEYRQAIFATRLP